MSFNGKLQGLLLVLISASALAADRWRSESPAVDGETEQAILKQLPAVVGCIEANDPLPCGIDKAAYFVGNLSNDQRADIFADGPVYIAPEYANTVTVTFAWGTHFYSREIIAFKRAGTAYEPFRVQRLVKD